MKPFVSVYESSEKSGNRHGPMTKYFLVLINRGMLKIVQPKRGFVTLFDCTFDPEQSFREDC
jgi:hypothetical protein